MPIIIAIGIMLLSILIVFTVKILTPYLWYEKLSSTCIKYVFIIEEYGYLTKIEKDNLINELTKQGFDKNKITINSTSQKQDYGKEVFLEVSYKYDLDLPGINQKQILMNIKRQSISKI